MRSLYIIIIILKKKEEEKTPRIENLWNKNKQVKSKHCHNLFLDAVTSFTFRYSVSPSLSFHLNQCLFFGWLYAIYKKSNIFEQFHCCIDPQFVNGKFCHNVFISSTHSNSVPQGFGCKSAVNSTTLVKRNMWIWIKNVFYFLLVEM